MTLYAVFKDYEANKKKGLFTPTLTMPKRTMTEASIDLIMLNLSEKDGYMVELIDGSRL